MTDSPLSKTKKLQQKFGARRTEIAQQREAAGELPERVQQWVYRLTNAANVATQSYVPPVDRLPNGLPFDWTQRYATSRTGPNGEPLPPLATGWDPYGRPAYNDPDTSVLGDVKTFFRQTLGRFLQPRVEPTPVTAFNEEFWKRMRGDGDVVNPDPMFGELAKLIDQLYNNARNGNPTGNEVVDTLIQGASRGIGGVLGAGLQALNVGSAATERVSISEPMQDIFAERSTLPELPEYGDWRDRIIRAVERRFWNPIRAIEARKRWTDEEIQNISSSLLQGSRIAYSFNAHRGLAGEYVRRLNEGEDPRMLALELEDPAAEAIGQTLNDPTLVWGAWKKALVGPAMLARAEAKWATVASDDVARILGSTIDNVAVDSARTTATRGEELGEALVRMMDNTRAELVGEAGSRGMFTLVADSKRQILLRDSLDYLKALQSLNDPQAVVDAMTAHVRLANARTAAEASAALGELSRIGLPVNVVLSDPANRFALVLSDLITDASGNINAEATILRDIIDANGDVARLAEAAGKRIASQADNIFPDVAQQVTQHDEYLRLLNEGDDVAADYLRRHPLSLKAPPEWQQFLSRAYDTAKKQWFSKWASFQGSMFFTWNPSFFARNRLVNGVLAWFRSGTKTAFKVLSQGLGGSEDEIARVLGYLPESGKAGFSMAGSAGRARGVGAFAAADERAARQAIILNRARQEMSGVLRPGVALAPTDALTAFSDSERNLLVQLVRESWGNTAAAEKILRQARGGGVRTLSGLRPTSEAALRDYRLYDAVVDAMRQTDNVEDAVKRINSAFNEWDRAADLAAREPALLSHVDMAAPEREAIGAAISALQQNLGDQATDLFTRQYQAWRYASLEYRKAMSEVRALALSEHQRGITARLFAERQGAATAQAIIDEAAATARQEFRVVSEPFEGAIEDVWTRTWQESDQFLEETWQLDRLSRRRGQDIAALGAQRQIDIGRALPADFRQALWDNYRAIQSQRFNAAREAEVLARNSEREALERLIGAPLDTNLLKNAEQAAELARTAQGANLAEDGTLLAQGELPGFLDGFEASGEGLEEGLRISRGAAEAFFQRATEKGMKPAEVLSNLDAHLRQAVTQASERAGVTPEEMVSRLTSQGGTPLVIPDEGITLPRAAHAARDGLKRLREEVEAVVRQSWNGQPAPAFTGAQERQLAEWMKTSNGRITEARLVAGEVGVEEANWALHDYGRRYGADLVAGLVYPYQFWYSRTYAKMFKNLMTHPEVFAAYGRYREFLEKKHASLPEWWRYQINTNEVFGLNSENPLYFNLESTLNPLYGLMGIDFNDPNRRADGISSLLDDANKFGPSIWQFYTLGLAAYYKIKGDDEAAARWGGRLTQGTLFLRNVTALAGINDGKGVEIDPAIWLFSGGIDPYERRRIGRMLSELQAEGIATEAELDDAAWMQSGPLWEEARARAIGQRAPGEILSYFLGVGFKARSQSDIQIDRMDAERNALIRRKSVMSPEDYRREWDRLRQLYPFMDAVLISRKGGLERDEAYSWSVLGRIPPGMTDDIAAAVGLEMDDVNAFWDNKGNLANMTQAQRFSFMGGIAEIGALLEAPPLATRAEWNTVSERSRKLSEAMQRAWGDDIWDRIDAYFASKDGGDQSVSDALLRNDPAIGEALDFRGLVIQSDPLMLQYYGSVANIEGYWKGRMYNEIERELGSSVWLSWDEYWRLKVVDPAGARAYWNQHPELERYTEIRDEWEPRIAERIVSLGENLSARPLNVRPESSLGQRLLEQEAGRGLPNLSLEQWASELGDPLFRIVIDAIRGKPLPRSAEDRLLLAAENLGLPDNPQVIVELIQSAAGY